MEATGNNFDVGGIKDNAMSEISARRLKAALAS